MCECVCASVCECVCVRVCVSVYECVCDRTSPPEKKFLRFTSHKLRICKKESYSILPKKTHRGSRGRALLTLNLGMR